MKFCCRIDQTA